MTWQPGDPPWTWRELPGRPYLASVRACEQRQWSIALWPTSGREQAPQLAPFLCGSWRCRRCAAWRGAVDFRRCSSAATSRPWWVYCVLTIHAEPGAPIWPLYRNAGAMWNNHLRESFRKEVGKVEYLQTWERTVAGVPHLNLLVSSDALRSWVELSGVERRWYEKVPGRGRWCLFPRVWRKWLEGAALNAGFGIRTWAEVVTPKARDTMAAYLVKLARELCGAASKKGDQSPLSAPPKFRRIRASRGLLPAPERGGTMTGKLVRQHWAEFEDVGARKPGERPPSRPLTWEHVERIIRDPEKIAAEVAAEWEDDDMANGKHVCGYCGQEVQSERHLENHRILKHRDRARITWDPEQAPVSKNKPEPKVADDDDGDDWGWTDDDD